MAKSGSYRLHLPGLSASCVGQDTARENSRVKKSRDKDKSPARPGSHGPLLVDSLFRELRDLMRQPRDLPACIVLVNDLALRRSHELRFGVRHRL
jgi:hypothetical protein